MGSTKHDAESGVDALIAVAERTATWLREKSVVVHEIGAEALAREMVVRAEQLDRRASWALSAPADESRTGSGWIDEMLETLKMPWAMPTRAQIVWLVEWAKRARAVVRHMVGVAEAYNEPAPKVAAAQRLLHEIDAGPQPSTKSGTTP